MPTPPTPLPADPDAQRADADAHALAMLRQLAELTLELATALQANALTQVHLANTLAEPVPQASVAAFDTIARGVRRTALALRHLAQPPRPARAVPARAAPDRAFVRQRVLRAVQDAIQAEAADDEQAERLHGEAVERLERPEFIRDAAALSLPALIADIVHDLGLAAPAGTRPWARRTPEEVAALAAWAAAPPGTPLASLPPLPPLRAWAEDAPDDPAVYAKMPDAELMRHLPPGTPWPGAPGSLGYFSSG